MNCQRPDRDEPKMICGYPLPCPHHTLIVEDGKVDVPDEVPLDHAGVAYAGEIAKALERKTL